MLVYPLFTVVAGFSPVSGQSVRPKASGCKARNAFSCVPLFHHQARAILDRAPGAFAMRKPMQRQRRAARLEPDDRIAVAVGLRRATHDRGGNRLGLGRDRLDEAAGLPSIEM
jgi:hypothetical protein